MASWMQYEEKVLVLNHLGETMFSFPYNINLDSIITDNPDIIESQTTQLTTDVFGKESIILSDTLNFSGWKVVRIINSDHIYEKTNQLAPLALIALGILFILTWMISLILSHSFTKPIRELHQHILKVENGNFKTMIPIKRKDELGQLAHSFNVMTQNLNELIQKMLIEEKEKSQMEFQILQSQINPHFLYNTLDSIKWLATIQNVDNIKDMTNSLINLLKYNISSKGTMVMLKEEIESIVNYVEIQKYRFGDIFEVYYDIPSQLENLFILRFILQPIIENSIIHGFEDIGNSQFHITIKAFTKDDILFIVITDNGKGMDDVAIETLFNTEDKRNVMHNGIGLKNIHDRIQLYFGPEFGLKISSLSNQGTSIQLSLRVLYKPDNQ
jgi:two-component system sensor histidine kinase YesM